MRYVFFFATVTVLSLNAQPSLGESARWCAHYKPGGTDCTFHSFEQCRASVSGIGGVCTPDRSYGQNRERRREYR
jgi:hypothetical protein